MRQTLRTHWPILVILLLAIGLRLPLLTGSFWMDEAAQALESARPWSQQLKITDDFQPPLLHLITALAIRVDDNEWWLRLWGALIPGLLSIVFTYAIGVELGKNRSYGKHSFQAKHVIPNLPARRRRDSGSQLSISGSSSSRLLQDLPHSVHSFGYGRWIGTIAALLLATSSFHIFYSQELRQYALPVLWATMSWWVILKQQLHKTGSKHWWVWGIGWSFISLLGLYSSYLYPFLLLAQVVFVLIRSIATTKQNQSQPSPSQSAWSSIKSYGCPLLHWLALFLLIKIGFLVWVPSFLAQLSAGQLLRLEIPGWELVVSTPQLKALALVGGKFLFGVTDLTLNPWFLGYTGLILLLLLGVGWYWVKFKPANHKQALSLLLIWLLVPLLTAWLVSFVVPVLQPKRVLFLLPAWCLLIGYLVSPLIRQTKQHLARFLGLALVATLLIFNLSSTVLYWLDPTLQREDWRQVWHDIDQTYGDATPKLFVFDAPFASWQWYDTRLSRLSMMNDFGLINSRVATPTTARFMVELATNVYTKPRLLYFDYLTDLTDPQHLVIQELEKHNYHQTDLLDYPNIGFIRVFEKSDPFESLSQK